MIRVELGRFEVKQAILEYVERKFALGRNEEWFIDTMTLEGATGFVREKQPRKKSDETVDTTAAS